MIKFPAPFFAPPDPPAAPPAPPNPPAPPAPPAPPSRPNEPSLITDPPKPPAAPITGLPENWRELMAGSDADSLKELQRFTDPAKIGSTLLNYKRQMRTGSFDTPPPPEDKPEELKAWREAHGVPTEEAGYKLSEDVTKRLFDEDKPVIANFISAAHKANQPQGVVDFAAKWYTDMMDLQASQQVETDRKAKTETDDALRSEWGPDYRRNYEAVSRFAKEAIPNADIFDARLPDGRKVGNSPEFLKVLFDLSIQKYGAAELVGEEQVNRAATRMAELEAKVADGSITPAERKEWGSLIAADEERKARKR